MISGRKGFTIVELLIVVAVIAVLAAITIVGYTMVAQNSRTATIKSDSATVKDALGLYGLNNASRFQPWFSSNTPPEGLDAKVSNGNFVDVAVTNDQKGWCARVFNPASSVHNTALNAFTVESEPGVCSDTVPSDQAYAASMTLGWKTLTAGYYHTCATTFDDKAYCWGAGDNYQKGNGALTNSGTPSAVVTSGVLLGSSIRSVTGGAYHTCVVSTNNTNYCWGQNGFGQVGDGGTTNTNLPVVVNASGVLAGKTTVNSYAGGWQSCALTTEGLAYCWGSGGAGALGAGNYTSSSTPVAVSTSGALNGKKLRELSLGSNQTCGLDTNNALYCWGSGTNGRLGLGNTTSYNTPQAVTGGALAGKTVIRVSSFEHSCAIASDSLVYCWGYNFYGQLGNGNTTTATAPIPVSTSGVLSGKKLVAVAAGYNSSCAIDTAGLAYCWGRNNLGQLGNNSTVDSSLPVAVNTSGVLAGKKLWNIVAGSDHFCAIATDGNAYCWGRNVYGQLGNGNLTTSTVPVLVVAP